MNKRVELLAPAGDLDRLKLALLYGADAVYIGGKQLSLRSAASNFTIEEIKEGVTFAHALNKKIYVTCNMVLHDDDTSEALEFLKALKECEVDGIITSSMNLINLNNLYVGNEMHISTQLSTLNSEAIKFYANYGVTRVVLGRECSIKEIEDICKNTPLEIEVFIHGGMCSSYSGRCMLSNVLTNRDANRGGCAHTCRWKYYFYQGNKKLQKGDDYFAISSKDLCAIKEIPALIKAGVSSLKIEGRMKSYNYLCAVISAYRMCIDDYYEGKKLNYKKYMKMISYGENRLTGHGFLYGNVTKEEQLLELNTEFKKAGEFIGIIRGYNKETNTALLEVKNKIQVRHVYKRISPNAPIKSFRLKKIIYKGQELESYTVAQDVVEIICDIEFKEYDVIHI